MPINGNGQEDKLQSFHIIKLQHRVCHFKDVLMGITKSDLLGALKTCD